MCIRDRRRTIYRTVKDGRSPFVMADKGFLEDKDLSWKAKGIMIYLLSRPNDWQVYIEQLKNVSKDGKHSTANGIKELFDLGYIERVQRRADDNEFDGYDYTIYESNNDEFKAQIGSTCCNHTDDQLVENGKAVNEKVVTTNNNLTKNERTKSILKASGELQSVHHAIVQTYINIYEKVKGTKHPPILNEDEIMDSLYRVMEQISEDEEDMIEAMTNYIKSGKGDGNINHFAGGIVYDYLQEVVEG